MTKNYAKENLLNFSIDESLRPSRNSVKFLLDYSKSLQVIKTKFGDFETIQN